MADIAIVLGALLLVSSSRWVKR
ncbi:hypothetical protein [Arsukibacterium indicum]